MRKKKHFAIKEGVSTISNRKRKVEAGVSVDAEAVESEALEKLREVEEIVKEV